MMENWRAKPRTGKSEIIPLAVEIQSLLRMGQTIKQVFDVLTDNQHISIGYRQFVRHVKTLTPSITPSVQVKQSQKQNLDVQKPTEIEMSSENSDSSPKTNGSLTREDLANIRHEPLDLKALSKPIRRPE